MLTSFCTSGKIFWAWIPALSVTLRSQTIRAGVDVGVNEQLAAIHTELLQMKEELEARLFEYSFFQQDSQGINSYQQATLMYHVKEELQDVLLAFQKSKTEHTAFAKKRIRQFRWKKWLFCRRRAPRTIFYIMPSLKKRRFLFGLRRMRRSTGRSTHNILQEGRAFALLQDVNEYSFTPFLFLVKMLK